MSSLRLGATHSTLTVWGRSENVRASRTTTATSSGPTRDGDRARAPAVTSAAADAFAAARSAIAGQIVHQMSERFATLAAMGKYDLGPRPRQLFLVELKPYPQPFCLAWKKGAVLHRVVAGFERMLDPSVTTHETADASPPTCESIGNDVRAAIQGLDADHLRVWDVSDHLGRAHPRINRPEVHLANLDPDRPMLATPRRSAEVTSSIAAAQLIFDDLDEVLAAIEPLHAQLGVYGHKPRQLLLLACMEVDSALKSVAVANGSTVKSPNFPDHARLAGPMRLGDWQVRLVRSTEGLTFAPFSGWNPQTPRLAWYTAYNNTKHGREDHLDEARLEHVLNAVAAAYVLLIAQFGAEARDRLRHRPFEVVQPPQWEPDECYVLSPFDDGPWRLEGCF